jgi:RimJ/RimL family protein N-acetyltransferase
VTKPLGPVTLRGAHIELQPLRPEHAPALLAAAQAEEIWAWMPARLMDRKAMDQAIAEVLDAESAGTEYPFTVVLRDSRRIIGSTRYLDVRPAHRGVEIGWTWYAPDTWATLVNPEAKYLLLRHAFETWGAIRVAFKTDGRNVRSQAAIRKLGAQAEGIHRSHRIRPDGTVRDTVWFSIIDSEWPRVKVNLENRLAAYR